MRKFSVYVTEHLNLVPITMNTMFEFCFVFLFNTEFNW